jgi:hypothetical protein
MWRNVDDPHFCVRIGMTCPRLYKMDRQLCTQCRVSRISKPEILGIDFLAFMKYCHRGFRAQNMQSITSQSILASHNVRDKNRNRIWTGYN